MFQTKTLELKLYYINLDITFEIQALKLKYIFDYISTLFKI